MIVQNYCINWFWKVTKIVYKSQHVTSVWENCKMKTSVLLNLILSALLDFHHSLKNQTKKQTTGTQFYKNM